MSFTFIIIFISYIVISGVIVASTALSLPLPPITTVILSVEQVVIIIAMCVVCIVVIMYNVAEVIYESILFCSRECI